MPIEGVDASYDRPNPVQLAAAGKRFFVGYVSPQSGKNLTAAECAAYHAANVAVCLVWENTGSETLKGYAQGVTDGKEARRQARLLGFPDDRPIYHAIDFDASSAQLSGPIAYYFRGVAAAEGSVSLVGAYGGVRQIGYLLDQHLVTYAWQTYAWSGGAWDLRAQAQQYHNGVQLAGGTVDLDRAMTDDYGQWEPDMSLTTADADKIWSDDTIANPPWRADSPAHTPPGDNPTVQARFAVAAAWDEAHAANVNAAAARDVALQAKASADAAAASAAATLQAVRDFAAQFAPPLTGDLQVTGTLHVGR